MQGQGSPHQPLVAADVRTILAQALAEQPLTAKRVLVIIPDGTRHAPLPLLFDTLCNQLHHRVAALDFLIALGTHPPMSETAIERHLGMRASEYSERYPGVHVYNHTWNDSASLAQIGILSASEVELLTEGLLHDPIPVTLNRLLLDYDHILICGPVFPHEVAGFSGGAKYLFPGIAGPDIINATHWLGALVTSMHTIGMKDTPVRRVIDGAARLVPRPISCIALAVKGDDLYGLFCGSCEEAWSAAADLSAQLEIVTVQRPFQRVLSIPSKIYDDLWTAAKAMYKTEPAIANGGEVIIYAPWLSEVSYTHGALIDVVRYHVRDYFTKQPDRCAHVPGMIKAHSTHVKGAGSYDLSHHYELPRIRVTLATAIPEERCKRINLGYLNPNLIHLDEWEGHEDQGILVVHNAGEVLYRLHQQ